MSKKRILIVEDEPIVAADLQDQILEMGYELAASVDTGEAALLAARVQSPDLILMDIHLSGELDGIETALRLRKLTDAPLIFLTSNSDNKTFQRARAAQPRAFISKPYRGRDLSHAIQLSIGEAPTGQQPEVPPPTMDRDDHVSMAHDRLFIKINERLVRILFSDILYFEADDYYCKIYTEKKAYLATKTLKKLSAQLPAGAPFFRCHRSYIVNLNQITEIGELYVFINKQKVPLSRSKRAEILLLVNRM